MIFRQFFCVGLLLSAALAYGQEQPALTGHWKFDGDAKDAALPAHDGVLTGKANFFDSPIGGSGKRLWCNGVDTTVHMYGMPNLAVSGFTASVWICPLDLASTGIVGQGTDAHGWAIELNANRAIHFRANGRYLSTEDDRIGFGQWYHIAVSSKAGGRMALHINGVLEAESDAAPGPAEPLPLRMLVGATDERGPLFSGLIDDLRIYNEPLKPAAVAKITDEGLPWLRVRPRAKTPFGGHFSLERDDVVVFVGGEDVNAAQKAGYLETLLTAGSAGKNVLFRDMAWEGDTVFEQWRILNFGPWKQQFERVGASVIFVQFGQMESLKGKAALDEFTSAYWKLLDEFQERTERIVIVSPTPFVSAAPPLPDLTSHNEDLKLYANAVKKISERRHLLYVDLTTLQQADRGIALKRDGVHLTEQGQWIAAAETARQLGVNATDSVTSEESPRFERKELEQIRTLAIQKNELWMRYWRPTNWAFLNGDRVSQPSSRDDVDRRIRWLPAEVQQFPAMIAKKEAEIGHEAKVLVQP